ncbi:piggyBac transposable element-derived protein 3-like [Dermacentor andersoni]|uniref:piggyBac transposable element-derived protein 3-like n=1 Tax=Dermacentor andersoni TaxID=34620 RepID=UPI0021552B0E|nr:piggyBac transposable element-derived protein 3-like [Dermacentor andersoni]
MTPSTIKDLGTPFQFFKFLCPVEVFKMIREKSLRYSIQCRPEKPLTVSVEELKRFVGMALYVSIIQLPSSRDYWSSSIGHHKVADVMCLNRWEELKRFLHFNNNETFVAPAEIGHDKLHKLRPLLNKLLEQLKIIPREEKLCIDEQIVPFKGRSSLKQYNPKKPHRWGYNVFALRCLRDFEVFSGAAENKQLPVPLILHLKEIGILASGTIRANELLKCCLKSDQELKKEGQGSMDEKVSTKGDIAIVRWRPGRMWL